MTNASYQKPESNSNPKIEVNLRLAQKSGSVLAWADVSVQTAHSKIEIRGIRVLQSNRPQESAWIAYPQTRGKEHGKYFPVVRVFGALHDAVTSAVLAQFEHAQRGGGSEPDSSNDIPF